MSAAPSVATTGTPAAESKAGIPLISACVPITNCIASGSCDPSAVNLAIT